MKNAPIILELNSYFYCSVEGWKIKLFLEAFCETKIILHQSDSWKNVAKLTNILRIMPQKYVALKNSREKSKDIIEW